jgi:excisionase family DNA binding protein
VNVNAAQPPTTSAAPDPFSTRVAHPALLSVGDVCLALQCGRTFVYELLRKGELRPIKLGRLTRISPAELHAFLHAKEAAAACSRIGRNQMQLDPVVRAAGRPRASMAQQNTALGRGHARKKPLAAAVAEQPWLIDTESCPKRKAIS